MDTVDIQLAQYHFKFRKLLWQEEFALKPGKRDPRRVTLAAALTDISGLKINGFDEAWRVLSPEAISTTLIQRMFIIYKGTLPDDRQFKSLNLYKAPEPGDYTKRQVFEEEHVDKQVDVVMQRMEEQFSKEELEEAKEVDRQILEGSRYRGAFRGAVPKSVDVDDEKNAFGGGYPKKA